MRLEQHEIENPQVSALRELEEETGVKAERAELLYEIYPTPGYTNEKIYIYQASDGEKAKTNLDEDEFLEVEWIDEGTLFRIHEYDGWESIEYYDIEDYFMA